MQNLSDFKKQKDCLVCVDSDGCAMDTMDIKHYECFGPCMIKEWALSEWREAILNRWNEINLYSMTRGINRFKGLALALSEIHLQYCSVDGIEDFVYWSENSNELSNDALKREIEDNPEKTIFKKALSWSEAVNRAITTLPDDKKLPFPLVGDGLAYAHKRADVVVVSSANADAVLEEWEQHGLLEHTDLVLAQNAGSKAFCIGELLKKGYDKDKVVMCGDAPGDLQAAQKNGVFFYPILVRHEKESWQEFIGRGFDKLVNGTYGGDYSASKINEFVDNLGGK